MIRTLAAASLAVVLAACERPAPYDVTEKSIPALQADLSSGLISSERLVELYLDRIGDIDDSGPTLNAVISLNPDALADAAALDAERAAGQVRGPLHGVPILVKDNIETADAMATTAGSLALATNLTGRDAPAIARLREAGAIILGKTNLSEWANMRSMDATSGWSAVGGLTRNPYALDRNACGSSSGSGAGVAASLAAAAIGTETDGSIVCPAAINGVVGIKPTVGLVSRTLIIPISASQDTAGSMARSVEDAAILLTALAGSDRADPATRDADAHVQDYAATLDASALGGARIGVARFLTGYHAETDTQFERALLVLREAGATLVELRDGPDEATMSSAELTVMLTEFKVGLNAYLAGTAPTVRVRDLAALILFNAQRQEEVAWFGQDLFETAQATRGLSDPNYRAALETSRRLAGPEGLDPLLAGVDAIVAPTTGPAWISDLGGGDDYSGSSSALPAVAGYPHVTVPMGQVGGLPVGLSFIGPAWSEARLLSLAYAYEQRAQARTPPTYAERLP